MLTKIIGPIISSTPALRRNIWRQWYQFLARGYKQEDWNFMNYGFAHPADGKNPPIKLEAADETDRCSIQLYHQVVTGIDVRGADLLEVGSGRGGGSSYIARYLQPKSMLGVDFSDNAVALSEERHSVPGLSFRQGDAESLPFEPGTFDIVVNVESSHCYASMDRFLNEVVRVLRPGGHFCWTDMRQKSQREAVRAEFKAAGLEMKLEENITPNVVLALDNVQDRKRAMISRYVPKFLARYFEDFAGVPGTRVYESLRAGEVEYWRCILQKPAK